jgi:septal ring factor EnvC (AmiA/AmiB activator)
MTTVRDLVDDARQEVVDEKSKLVKAKLKEQIKDIASCKNTLKELEKDHKDFLDQDIEDIEDDDLEY